MNKLLADELTDLGFTFEQQIAHHLSHNIYPPVPRSMVKPCIEAIGIVQRARWGDAEVTDPVELPPFISLNGVSQAPAITIVQSFKLESWLD